MEYEAILLSLRDQDFQKVTNECETFEKDATIFAKEIRKNIFLLFVIHGSEQTATFRAFIANFDAIESIGKQEPIQVILYLTVTKKEDLHYLERYIKA